MIEIQFIITDNLPESPIVGGIYFEKSTNTIKVVKDNSTIYTFGDGNIESCTFSNDILDISVKGQSLPIKLDFGSIESSKKIMPVFSEIDSKMNIMSNKLSWYNSDKEELPNEEIIKPEVIEETEVVLDIIGDKEYLCGELTSLTLASIAKSNRLSIIRFTSGSIPTTISYPEGTKVAGLEPIKSNATYIIFVYMGDLTIIVYE